MPQENVTVFDVPPKIKNRPEPEKKRVITTNIQLLPRARSLWHVVIASYLIDALALLTDAKVELLPPQRTIVQFLIIGFLFVSAALWLYSLSPTFSIKFKPVAHKQRYLLVFFALCIALPMAEIIFHLQIDNAPFVMVVLLFTVFAVAGSFRSIKKQIEGYRLPPRNLFLHIVSNDRKIFAVFAASMLSARAIGGLSLVLFLDKTATPEFLLLFEAASITMLYCFRPTPSSFYSVCPTCKQFRSKVLSPLLVCPSCSKRKFHWISKTPTLSLFAKPR